MKIPSYQESCKYFSKKKMKVPLQDDIGYDFAKKLHMFVAIEKPHDNDARLLRRQERLHVSRLLGQILNNEGKWSRDSKSSRDLLPYDIKIQRDKDIKSLLNGSYNDESTKRAFVRFESVMREYLPNSYKKILEHYANDMTKRLSMQKIIAELKTENKGGSLLYRKVINIIE